MMRLFVIELRKERRTGVFLVFPLAGVLGAVYAFLVFHLRKDTLLNLPSAPMDILLTQLCGMMTVFNLFGIITAACMVCHMEFQGGAAKKMAALPVSAGAVYFCRFLILSMLFLAAAALQNLALLWIGRTDLPQEAFALGTLLRFAGYVFLAAMPVLSFMVLLASCLQNMWVPLGVGVAGFLTGMAFADTEQPLFLLHPFVVMLKPAAAMNAKPDIAVVIAAIVETAVFLCMGFWLTEKSHYE